MNTRVASSFEGLTCISRHAIKARLCEKLLWDHLPLPECGLAQMKSDAAKLSTPISCLVVEACSEPRPCAYQRRSKGVRAMLHAGKEAPKTPFNPATLFISEDSSMRTWIATATSLGCRIRKTSAWVFA